MVMFKFVIEKYCSFADFSGIFYSTYLTLPKEVSITRRQYFYVIRVSEWWWWKKPMLLGYIRRKRYHFAKNDVFFVYSRIVQTKINLIFYLCTTMTSLCFGKLRTNILGQICMLFAALVCIYNKTRNLVFYNLNVWTAMILRFSNRAQKDFTPMVCKDLLLDIWRYSYKK